MVSIVFRNVLQVIPSKQELLTQCWFNVGATSATFAQHQIEIDSAFCGCLVMCHLAFHPVEVASRYRDPQLQLGGQVFNLKPDICQS